jgi:membrane protease YdiL (CAAX protease family)
MRSDRPASPAAALLSVALVWSLVLLASRGAHADLALLGASTLACAALVAQRPGARGAPGNGSVFAPARSRASPPWQQRAAGRVAALALAAAAGFASFPFLLAAVAAAGSALALAPPPALVPPGAALALLQLGPGPLLEELLYRERLLCALRPALGAPGAVVASSALFAAAHPEPWSFLAALGVGLALGAFFARTGALAESVAAHVGLNGAGCLWSLAWTPARGALP